MSRHRISIAGSELSFDCAGDQDVLDAALRAGVELPYSCRKGVCANCACVVTAGEVAGAGGRPLANEATPSGQVLLCAAVPRSDLVIAPPRWSRMDPSARRRFAVRVFRNAALAPDVTLLQLRLPAGQRAKFRAGQYLRLMLPDGDTRSYSMANAPHESDALTLHVRRLPGGRFSDRLLPALNRGDMVEVELPHGRVDLAVDDDRPIVFVAGGTGFAPVRSILDDFMRRKVRRPVTLVWAARTVAGLYLLSALAGWRRQFEPFRFVPAVSDESPTVSPAGLSEPLFAGRADQALDSVGDTLSGSVVYCCGGPPMVEAVRAVARARGVAEGDFHADVFVDGTA